MALSWVIIHVTFSLFFLSVIFPSTQLMGCQLRGPVVDVAVDRYFVYSLGEETVGKTLRKDGVGSESHLVNSMSG